MTGKIIIGTRASKLALWQTNWVKGELESAFPDIKIEIEIITTKGDRILDVSLPELGEQGKGLFTKELEEAMIEGRIDLAVHSLKDLPTELPAGLEIAAICRREDARDALVARPGTGSFDQIPSGAIIGTSSLRRQAQIRAARKDVIMEPARGNVDTRLGKLDAGLYDALVLASAGLHRLGLRDRITEYISEDLILPAVGQGALAIEARAHDEAIREIVLALDHLPTRLECRAERAFLKGLGGGCLVPIAARCRFEDGKLHLKGLVANSEGSEIMRDSTIGPANDPESTGRRLADRLLERGADRLLERV
ncbi:MAG: hydroxymethylbilane synthase [Blastocatellia bacterium]|nr:hydroxymethylbilane synthase [Blastocatellia bacterium]